MAGESIRVVFRIRPLNPKEIAMGEDSVIKVLDKKSIKLEGKQFNFDHILPMSTTQEEAYNVIGKPCVEKVLEGFNGTIFAYGQTSSGKTHTMEGYGADRGIIPRIVNHIFDTIYSLKNNMVFLVKVEYYEIYMEKVKDLFDNSKDNLPIIENASKMSTVKGGTERFVTNAEEVQECLDEGRENRKVASTNMNARSSRSHSVFILTLISDDKTTQRKREGRMYLIDLAGSEKTSKTGAEGQTFEEAKTINKSLSVLGAVINALCEGKPHVPYRDSKLTRLLQSSLGGNSKTTLVICASPAQYNVDETKFTCYFGLTAKSVKNNVTANVELTADEWKMRFASLAKWTNMLCHEAGKRRKNENVASNEMANLIEVLKLISTENLSSLGGLAAAPADAEPDEQEAAGLEAFGAPPEDVAEGEEPTEDRRPVQRDAGFGYSGKPTKALDPRAESEKDAIIQKLLIDLDEKEEEISRLTTEKNNFNEIIMELRACVERLKISLKNTENNCDMLASNLRMSKTEVNEMCIKMNEMTHKYEEKSAKLVEKSAECDVLKEQLLKLTHTGSANKAENSESVLKIANEKFKINESIRSLIHELSETQKIFFPKLAISALESDTSLESTLVAFKLYVGKIKCEYLQLKTGSDANNPINNLVDNDVKIGLKDVEHEAGLEMINSKSVRNLLIGDLKRHLSQGDELANQFEMLNQTDKLFGVEEFSVEAILQDRIKFLESYLRDVSNMDKQTIKDNWELACEISRLEKRLKASNTKSKILEQTLKDLKNALNREKKRFQFESQRMRNSSVRSKSMFVGANIARPIITKAE